MIDKVRIAPISTSQPAKPLLANDAIPGIRCDRMLRLIFGFVIVIAYKRILGSRYA